MGQQPKTHLEALKFYLRGVASGSSFPTTGWLGLEAPGVDFRALRESIFEALGQQETKRQEGRTCKTWKYRLVEAVSLDSISQFFTSSHLLSLASMALSTCCRG